jgi:hypothetical protein
MTTHEFSPTVSAPDEGESRWKQHARLAVHLCAAMLLVVAACLKAYGVLLGPQSTPLGSRASEFALIEFELLLGGLLLLRVAPTLTWATALATFTIFAGVSARKAMLGSSSCGCFGPASVSPRVMVAIDLVTILLLLWAGPRTRTANTDRAARGRFERIARFVGISTITLLMFLSAAAVTYAAVPKRGLVADHAEYDFGTIQPLSGATCDHTFTLRNTSGHAIRIIDCHSSCGCTVADYPTDPIAPGASAAINVHADWSNVVLGDPQAQVTLTTDNWMTRTVPLVIRANLAAR